MNIPKIRFKQNNGENFPDWAQVKIYSLGEFIRGQTYSRDQVTLDPSATFIVRSSNLIDGWFVDFCKDKQLANVEVSDNELLKSGDVVICTANGSTSLVGKASIYDGRYSGSISWGAFCSVFRSNQEAPLAKYFFRTPRYRKLITSMKQGGNGALGNLNVKEITNVSIPFPCAEEQQKIASFFSTLDQKIELNERKLEALEKLKKGLMQKIFSQNIRFKNSDGTNYPEWRTARFFDIVESIIDFRGRTPKKLGLDWAPSATEYLALSALNVKNWGIDTSAEAHYGDEKLYKKWMTGKELHKGQVLLTTEAPAGIVMQIPDEKKYILSQRVIALNVKQDSISEVFLSQLLKSEKVQQDIRKLSTGGTAIGISQKSLRNLYLYFPSSIQEQQAIGNLFVSLDDKLQLTKKRVEKLQALKRGFMQQMFV